MLKAPDAVCRCRGFPQRQCVKDSPKSHDHKLSFSGKGWKKYVPEGCTCLSKEAGELDFSIWGIGSAPVLKDSIVLCTAVAVTKRHFSSSLPGPGFCSHNVTLTELVAFNSCSQ